MVIKFKRHWSTSSRDILEREKEELLIKNFRFKVTREGDRYILWKGPKRKNKSQSYVRQQEFKRKK